MLAELLVGDNLHVCLDRIVREGSLLPNIALAQKQAEEALDIAPLQALISLMERLQSEKGLTAETATAYFERWGLAQEQDIAFLRLGFEKYFGGDHVCVLHILVPRYEAILRSIFEAVGTATYRSRRTLAGAEFEPLGGFLNKPEVKGVLRDDLRTYIGLVLAEQHGWNLRNRIAHGLVRREECTALQSTTVFHLLLLLTLFTTTGEDEEE